MVKDGGIVTAYDAKTGNELYQKRAAATGSYYASPVAANGNVYLHVARRRHGDGARRWLADAESRGQESAARRTDGGHAGDRGRHAVRADGEALYAFANGK